MALCTRSAAASRSVRFGRTMIPRVLQDLRSGRCSQTWSHAGTNLLFSEYRVATPGSSFTPRQSRCGAAGADVIHGLQGEKPAVAILAAERQDEGRKENVRETPPGWPSTRRYTPGASGNLPSRYRHHHHGEPPDDFEDHWNSKRRAEQITNSH